MMSVFRNRFSLGLSLAIVLSLLLAPLALADNVQDDVSGSGPVTFVAGGSTTIKYWIQDTGSDGCGASDGTPALITINAPAGITLTPSSLTFTACGTSSSNTQSVVYTSNSPGTYSVTLGATDIGGDSYNTNPANVSLTVNLPPDNTSPVITANVSGTLGNNGWYTSDVAVSWSVVDNESAISSSSGCGSTTISTDTAGVTLTCSATSAGGTNSQSVTIKRDATPPVATASVSPAANASGWNNTNVTVTFDGTDALSGKASCSAAVTLNTEGRNESASGTCTDNAGNISAPATVTSISIDMTAPNAPLASTDRSSEYTDAFGASWFINNVTVSFSGNGDPDLADGSTGSGVDLASLPLAVTFNTTGAHTAYGAVNDLADNPSAGASLTVQVDASKPTVDITCPANPVLLGSSAAAAWTASDVGSGLSSAATGSVSLDTTMIGSKTATAPAATATDHVGLTSNAAACSYSVIYDWSGFFAPVDNLPTLNVAKSGSAIPVKFNLGGYQGLEIFSAGYPKSIGIACDTSAPLAAVEETVTAGSSSLTYDTVAGQYVYVWKTDKAWAGTCRQFSFSLVDGTTHSFNVKFTR